VSGDHAAPTAVPESIGRGLVAEPDEVRVEVEEDGDRLQLNVFVPQSEMGRVIGKRGRTAHAIRTLVRAAAARDGIEVDSIEFVD
jgi:predicted RNA-binding protein YlqC (UPF0109 family)